MAIGYFFDINLIHKYEQNVSRLTLFSTNKKDIQTKEFHLNKEKGMIFNIKRYALHDGPGIRTTIFLKGCPLKCLWCSNPESQYMYKQLVYFKEKCTSCGNCYNICPEDAIIVKGENKPIEVNFEKCAAEDCGGICSKHCYHEALVILGKEIYSDEVVAVIKRDKGFYKRTGGGVTLSGGDPLMQAEFSSDILKKCKQEDIHTAIQTSGFGSVDKFDLMLPYLDLVIFDIKHTNSKVHYSLTGVSNLPILRNLDHIYRKKASIVLQFPLIPGCNDDEENISGIIDLFKHYPNIKGLSLIPYHRLGVSKYHRIGLKYQIEETDVPSDIYIQGIKSKFAYNKVNIINF